MARSQFAHPTWPTPHRSHIHPGRHHPGTSGLILGIASALVLFGATAASQAASGPGIGLKIGAQTFEDPGGDGKITRARAELEVASPLLFDEHLDFAFAFGGSYAGTYNETYTETYEDGSYADDLYTDRLWLGDIRLAARLYPLGDHCRLRPYVGAGIGYFWFNDDWDNHYSTTYLDPPVTIHEHEGGYETLANGFFPFVTAGLSLPLGEHAEILFEFQYDIDKKDSGFDLSGPIYMAGARIRF